MSAILIISIFLVFVASFVFLRTKRSPSNESSEFLPPGISPKGLFGDLTPSRIGNDCSDAQDAIIKKQEELEKSLLGRAALGDLEALRDAHAQKSPQLYRHVFDAMVERAAKNADDLHLLAAFIMRDAELRTGSKLAELLLADWERNPTRAATAELLRVAALSDDAQIFERASEAVLHAWESARLNGLSAVELRSLIEAEYWLLSSEAKRSGAGFRLKQRLADTRQRLSQNARRENPTNRRRVD